MEVHIGAQSTQGVPDGTFMSMRIGDVQKQSRFAASRTYRFPAPGDKNGTTYGRLEIFQRVGHVTLSFDGSQTQNVEVPCEFLQGSYQMGLQVTAKGAAAATGPATDKKKNVRQRLDAAQEYLDKHRLEELLAEVMHEVMHHKPDDPHAFISGQILQRSSSGNGGGFLPKIAGAYPSKNEINDGWAAAPPPAPEPAFKAQEPSTQLARPLSPGETSSKKLPPLALGNEPGQSASPPLVQQGSSLNFQTFNQPQELAAKPAASTGLDKVDKLSPSAFNKLPSTGTWIMKLPVQQKMKTTGADDVKQANAATSPYNKLPSVGTWLVPMRMKASDLKATDANDVKQAKAATGPYNKLPSVGTWLAPMNTKKSLAASPAPEEQVFKLRPSVGTWLTSIPPKVERPWYYQVYSGEDAELVHKMQEVISEKDKELVELKAQLARLGIEV